MRNQYISHKIFKLKDGVLQGWSEVRELDVLHHVTGVEAAGILEYQFNIDRDHHDLLGSYAFSGLLFDVRCK
ncbi:hypothetical protein D3C80_1594040 [compost metagenome]